MMGFMDEVKKNKNRFNSKINDEGDRAKFDFFDTYKGTKNCKYEKSSEMFYFSKKNSP